VPEDEYLSITQVAEALGVSRPHVYTLIERGLLAPERNPLYRKHGPVRIPKAQVDALKKSGGR
jgi:excisionase family DNA binding protein